MPVHPVVVVVIFKTDLFCPIDGTLTGTSTPGQSGLESNGNKGVLHIP